MDKSEENSYSKDFDSKLYLQLFYTSVEGSLDEKGATSFHLNQVLDFYRRYNSKWDINAARLLEFGGGPSITGLISAAPYFKQIVFSAHTESERKEVEMWKFEKDGAHDWSNHFKFVANELEGIAGDAVWQDREKLLRQCITSIIGCDIFQDYPLSIKQDPFEVIYTSLCLEAACITYTEYKAAVRKLVTLIKLGGFLVMLIVERQTFYMVGNKKWTSLYLTLEQVKEALAEAGMVVLVAERDVAPLIQIQNPTTSDYKALLFVAAQRVECWMKMHH